MLFFQLIEFLVQLRLLRKVFPLSFCSLLKLFIDQLIMPCILLVFAFKLETSPCPWGCCWMHVLQNGPYNDQETMFLWRWDIVHADKNFLLQRVLGHERNHPQFGRKQTIWRMVEILKIFGGLHPKTPAGEGLQRPQAPSCISQTIAIMCH